jgi:acylphosphatase
MNNRIEAELSGRVQGVGFRMFVKEKADFLDIKGVVSNTSKGTVKVIAEGAIDNLEEFITILNKGTIFSSVINIDYSLSEYKNEFKDFQVIKENKLLKDQLNPYKHFALNLFK